MENYDKLLVKNLFNNRDFEEQKRRDEQRDY